MKLKPKTYYIENYGNTKDECYNILYTGTKHVYSISNKHKNEPYIKYNKKYKWETITRFQEDINKHNIDIKEISKGDVFLELL